MEANNNTPSILDVVKGFTKLTVDDYQRSYAWEKDQIEGFFADLHETAATGEPHFFGTLILQSTGVGKAAVVDGQQRLTTTYVMVAALRDAALKLDSSVINEPGKLPIYVAQEAWNFLIPSNDPSVPRYFGNRFLTQIILDSVLPEPDYQKKIQDSHTRITLKFRKAVKLIREFVREDLEKYESQELKLKRIYRLLFTLTHKFLVLRVLTDNMSESLEIFLTLNNRGLPLGPSDIVRGEIIAARGVGLDDKSQLRLQEQIFNQWKTIEDNVGDPEVFLRHYLVATSNKPVTKKQVVDRVIDRIKNSEGRKDSELAKTLWQDLMDAAETYSYITNPGYNNDTNYQLYLLDGLLKSHRIFMLSLLRSKLSATENSECVRLLFVLCFRYTMAGLNAQQLENFFQKQSEYLLEGQPVSFIQDNFKEKIADILLDTHKYLKNEGDSGFTGKAILHALNRFLAPSALQFPLDSKIHVEHIAPQTSNVEWMNDLYSGNEDLFDGYDDRISEIGNLTLLDFKINSELQRSAFTIKKSKYSDSVLKITKDLVKVTLWRQEEIEARTDYVAEMFDLIWAVKPELGNLQTFPDWYASRG